MNIVDAPDIPPGQIRHRAAPAVRKQGLTAPKAKKNGRPSNNALPVMRLWPNSSRSYLPLTSHEFLLNQVVQRFLGHTLSRQLIAATHPGKGDDYNDVLANYAEKRVMGQDPALVEHLESEVARCKGNTLFTPDHLDNRHLKAYVDRMGPFALTPTDQLTSNEAHKSRSLHLLPLLLGGIPYSAAERLCIRALRTVGVDVFEGEDSCSDFLTALTSSYGLPVLYREETPVPIGAVNRRIDASGMGSFEADTTHYPEVEDEAAYVHRLMGRAKGVSRLAGKQRLKASKAASIEGAIKEVTSLSTRQNWMLKRSSLGCVKRQIMNSLDLFDVVMQSRLERLKSDVCREAAVRLQSTFEMTPLAAKRLGLSGVAASDYLERVRIDDAVYRAAMERVFNEPWCELDLTCDPENLEQDAEVVTARALIAVLYRSRNKAGKPPQLGAHMILGASVLTGVPVACWIRWCAEEMQRKGEAMISSDTIYQIIDMVDMSELCMHMSAEARSELEELARRFRVAEIDPDWTFYMAENLRKGGFMLWSRGGGMGEMSYHLLRDGEDPRYKPKPDPRLSASAAD